MKEGWRCHGKYMLFLSKTIIQPNELPAFPFACASCTAHCFHPPQGVGHRVGHFLHAKELSPELPRTRFWPFGAGLGQTSSLQPAEAAPPCSGRSRIAGADRGRTCTFSYVFEKQPAHISFPFSGFEVI